MKIMDAYGAKANRGYGKMFPLLGLLLAAILAFAACGEPSAKQEAGGQELPCYNLEQQNMTDAESLAKQDRLAEPDHASEKEPDKEAESRAAALQTQRSLISVGTYVSAAITHDGALWAWGQVEELGLGSSPVQLGTDKDWVSVTAGVSCVLAIKADASLWSWGRNFYGMLGDGTTYARDVLVQIGKDGDWASVAAGEFHIVAIRTDGSLWAWGINSGAELGIGEYGRNNRVLEPVQVGTDRDWARLSASSSGTAAIKTDGSLWVWGRNTGGWFGDGTIGDRYTPRQAVPMRIGADIDWASIATDGDHTVAIKADGSLWAWGANRTGQLGDGSTTSRLEPVQIGAETDWAAVTAGNGFTIAMKGDGSLWGWGFNGQGQLGDGAGRRDQHAPAQIGTDTDWLYAAAGGWRTVAMKDDGSIWSWGFAGEGWTGLIGDGTTENSYYPVRIK